MTPARLTIGLLVVAALGIGLLIGRSSGSDSQPAVSQREGAVSSSSEEIVMPGLWLGKKYRQAVPMLSLTKMPGQEMNGLFYALIAPARELVAIEPYPKDRPIGWKTVKTPVGDALVNDKQDTAWIVDPQGKPLRIYSYTGQVQDALKALQKRTD